jgi:hypothetical protein
MVKYLITGFLAMLLQMHLAFAREDILHDPTKPPAKLGLMTELETAEEKAPLVLQSVTLGTTMKSAMINGKTVLLGQQFEGLTLVKLSAGEAVLKGLDGQTQVLKMDYPFQKKTIDVLSKPVKSKTTKRHAMMQAANESK